MPQAYVVISSAFIARYLGPSGFGRLTLILSVQAAVTAAFSWGLPAALIRSVGELLGAGRPAEVHGLIRWSYRMTARGAAASFAVIGIAALAGARPQTAWLLVAISTPFAVMHSVPSSLLTGAQRWRDARVVGMTSGLLAMVAKVVAVVAGGGITSLVAIDLCVALINLTGTALLSLRVQRPLPPPKLTDDLRRQVRRFALVSSITVVVALVVYQRTEIFFLARYSSDAAVAQYSVPYSLLAALLLIPSAVASVLSPAFASLWGAGEIDRIRSGFSRSLRLVIRLSLVLTGFMVAVGGRLIELIYGSAFAHVGSVLTVLVISLPLVPLATLSNSLLRGIGTLRGLTIVGVVAALANLAFAFALVPPFGSVGAAAANSLAQVVGSVPLVIYAIRRLGGIELDVFGLTRMATVLLIATLLGAFVAAHLPALPALFTATAVYALVALAAARPMRVISKDDASWIALMLGDRAAGLPAAFVRYAGGLARGVN